MKSYRVEVQDNQLRLFDETADQLIDSRPLAEDEIGALVAKINRHCQPPAPDITAAGKRLYDWLDDPSRRWLKPRLGSDPDGVVLYIDVEGLRQLPWELLHDGSGFLCARRRAPFTPAYRIQRSRSGSTRVANRPLRMLFMACAPEPLAVLNFEQEEALILQATESLRGQQLALVVEESGSRQGLSENFAHYGSGYFDVLHLSGHAGFDADGRPAFMMETVLGEIDQVTADELAEAMNNAWPRLVFLSGCRTGQAGQDTAAALPSMCEALVAAGAPAVLGWSQPIGDGTATSAAAIIYTELAQGNPIYKAIANARKKLHQEKLHEWHLLRLYADTSPLEALVTVPATEGRERLFWHKAEAAFLEAGKVKVCPETEFVGRRRLLQRGLRCLRASPRQTGYAEGLLLTGIGGYGKSSLAVRLCQRMSDYQRVVIVGALDEPGLLRKLQDQLATEAAVTAVLNQPDLSLKQRLRNLFQDHLKQPLLLVLDDFEQNCEGYPNNLRLDDHQAVLRPQALNTLAALLFAIRQSGSLTRLIVTCRYRFVLPAVAGAQLEELPLAHFNETEEHKKLARLSPVWRDDSKVARSLRERALKLASGNPRLLERLDTVLSNAKDNDRLAGEVVALLDALETKTDEFREEILLRHLLQQQSQQGRRLLARVSVCQLPIDRDAVIAIGNESEPDEHLNSATALGLIEIGLSESNTLRYCVPGILAPLLDDVIKADERYQAYQLAARHLYPIWWQQPREAGTGTHEAQALEVHRLAIQAGEQSMAAEIAIAIANCWYQQARYREAQALCQATLVLTKHHDLYRLLGDTKAILGQPHEALHDYRQALAIAESIGDAKGKAATLHEMAGVLAQQGKVDEAMKLWQQSLAIEESIGDVQGQASTLHQMARGLAQQGKPEEAMKLWQQSLAIEEPIGNVRGKAATLHEMARLLAQQGKSEKAMQLWQQALAIFESIGDVRGKAVTLANMAGVLAQQGKPEEAMQLYQQALAIFESIGDVRSQAATLHNMAGILAQQGKIEEAMKLWQQSLAIEEPIGNVRGKAVTLHEVAGILAQQGKLEEAMKLYQQALAIFESIGDVEGKAVTLHKIAGILAQQGKLEEAMELWQQSLAILEPIGNVKGKAATLHAMAGVLAQQGKPEEAMKLWQQSLAIKESIGNVRGKAATLHKMAGLLAQQGKVDEAMKLWQQALAILESIGDAKGKTSTLTNMAGVLAQQGKPKEAMKLYQQSLAIAESAGNVGGKAATLHQMAGVLAQQGKLEEAMKLWQQALAILESIGDVQGKAATLHEIAGVLAQQGKPEEAMKLWQQALAIAESIGDAKGKAAILHEKAGVLAQQGKPEEAMELWQQSLKIEESIGDAKGKTSTLTNMAGGLAQQGKPKEAMKLWQQALEIEESIGDVQGKAATLHEMAGILAQQGKPEKAMELWQQSLAILEPIGNVKGKAATLHAMAGVLAQQGKPEEAMELWQQSLKVEESIGNVKGKAATLHEMAGVLAQQGKPEEAMKLWQQALEIFESIGDAKSKAVTLHAMAVALAQQDQPEEAMQLWQQALEIEESIGDAKGKAATLTNMGEVLAQQGKPEEAMKLWQQALEILESIGDVRNKAAILHEKAGVLAQQGKPEEAMKLYQQSLEIKESIGDVRNKAATLDSMAGVLAQQDQPEEAMKLWQQALAILESIGDVRNQAIVRQAMEAIRRGDG